MNAINENCPQDYLVGSMALFSCSSNCPLSARTRVHLICAAYYPPSKVGCRMSKVDLVGRAEWTVDRAEWTVGRAKWTVGRAE